MGRAAHRASGESVYPGIAARLQEVLGREVVAIITGETPRQVSLWVSGDAKPTLDEQQICATPSRSSSS